MGQTLSNGVYLPNEGERNCYAGLASNWQILNTAVGNIAEKAPLVHPHGNISNDGKVGTTANLPLITGTGGAVQAGSFGNQANTFCEGNDSRLSDARTPVAHTHLTADVTDLLNSAHTWTGENTYSKTVAIERNKDSGNFLVLKNTEAELGSLPSSITPATIAFRDKDNDNLGYMGVYYDTDGSNHFRLYVRNKYTSGAPSTTGSYDYAFFGLRLNADKSKEGIIRASFRPYDNNTYDLGSSRYQWNNLYAKNYYYNGTAWGLDKANVWSGNNRFQALSVSSTSTIDITQSTLPSATTSANFSFNDNGERYWGAIRTQVQTDRSNILKFIVSNWKTNGTQGTTELDFFYDANLDKKSFFPSGKNVDLGTSTNKWKTLNGINPGALSLPDIYDSYDVVTTNWSTAYNQPNDLKINGADPSYPGWLSIRLDNCTAADDFVIVRYFHVNATNLTFFGSFIPTASSYVLSVPIQAGITTKVWVSKIPTTCKYYACLGTVK